MPSESFDNAVADNETIVNGEAVDLFGISKAYIVDLKDCDSLKRIDQEEFRGYGRSSSASCDSPRSGTSRGRSYIDEDCEGCEAGGPSGRRKTLGRKITNSISSVFAPKSGEVWSSSLVLVKGALGAGVLALSYATFRVGAAYMFAGMVFGAGLTVLSLVYLGEAALKTDRWSYEAMSKHLTHGKFKIVWSGFSAIVMLLNCMGSMIVYTSVIKHIFEVMINETNPNDPDDQDADIQKYMGGGHGMTWAQFCTIMLILVLLLPLSLLRKLNFLRYFAMAALGGWIFLMITQAYYLGRYGVDDSIENAGTIFVTHEHPTFWRFFNAFATITFAFCNQFNMPQVANELTKQTKHKILAVALTSTTISTVLFAVTIVLGLLAFGVTNLQSDLIQDFRLKLRDGDVMIWICLLWVMFSVAICYNCHVFPIRRTMRFVVASIRGKSSNATDEEDTKVFGNLSWARFWDLVVGVVVVVGMTITALLWDDFGTVVSFIGAFCSSYLAYVAPSVFILLARRKYDHDFRWGATKNILPMIICAFGCVFMVMGSIGAFIAD